MLYWLDLHKIPIYLQSPLEVHYLIFFSQNLDLERQHSPSNPTPFLSSILYDQPFLTAYMNWALEPLFYSSHSAPLADIFSQ